MLSVSVILRFKTQLVFMLQQVLQSILVGNHEEKIHRKGTHLVYHYENMSVQYEIIYKSGKNDIFRCKNVTCFLIFAQNIDCGDTLEPPQ